MRTMKKVLRVVVCWCIPGMLLLPLGGCFSAMSHFMGASPSTGEAIGCATLDVVTMPVQAAVIGPFVLKECIDANTGERGRAKRRQEEIGRYKQGLKQELTADFSKVYSDAAFISPTNTPARETLGEWLGHYNVNHPRREEIDPLAERLLNDYDAAYALRSILAQKNLSPDLKKRLCVSLVEGSRTRTMDRQSKVVNLMLKRNYLSESELRSLISDKGDSTDKVIEESLRACAEAREEERKRGEEYAARVSAEAAEREAERRKREEERQRAQELRYKELQELAKGLKGGADEFRAALAVRNELAVCRAWAEMLNHGRDALPAENVRLLAEMMTEPGEPGRFYLRYLFPRLELTDKDLRRLYPRVLAKLREPGEWQKEGWRYAAALITNRNFPPDLVRLSYDEPLLTEFRICYVRHHWRPDGTKRNELELQKFTQECDALKHDCEKGKISFDASSTRRFELTKKYLSAECPDDWDKFIIP